ncbi:hypothetical protein COY16_02870 [Candidatus Roizmanbacteria bacterium CG_4_10_14_0_2_um_filter_39_13]|uniref:Uncharacterized protein n=1 Tax=Candidatus Roizmanbacteria bacterium CG_4_10_14_0_2_um_filter_39_13 TaxID=1974825 RepID=A0A2M7TZ39_9BACT|nr:MAG: hypothetical protein COY16_02870 [Candidatus Roizmanbacteria bacterium CG_4_10_14_0_2_um_filter_39_13]
MDNPKDKEITDNLIIDNPKSEHKSPSRLMLIVGGIMLLFIGLVIGYYFSQKSQYVAIPQTTPSPIPSPEAGDEIEGWKTYVNEEYGFEFKYYKDQLEVIECFRNNVSVIFILSLSKKQEYDVCKVGFALNIKQVDTDFALSKSNYDSHNISTDKINIDSQSYTKYVGIRKDEPRLDGMPTSAVSKFIYIPIKKDDKTLLISLEMVDPQKIYYEESLLGQILSTFEFVK